MKTKEEWLEEIRKMTAKEELQLRAAIREVLEERGLDAGDL